MTQLDENIAVCPVCGDSVTKSDATNSIICERRNCLELIFRDTKVEEMDLERLTGHLLDLKKNKLPDVDEELLECKHKSYSVSVDYLLDEEMLFATCRDCPMFETLPL